MSSSLRGLLAASTLFASAASFTANAATYDFGALLSGSFQPGATFAELSVTSTGTNVYDFRLEANDLDALFADGAALGRLAVETDPAVTKNDVAVSNVAISWGTATPGSVEATNGGGPTGVWDFSFSFNDKGRLVEANEWVQWTATFSTTPPVTFAGFALHVQRIRAVDPAGSAWYVPTPIPEPETYAMLLAGLGLLGFFVRRRKERQ
jgi:hypothetical protein